jgi:hypothetical protein
VLPNGLNRGGAACSLELSDLLGSPSTMNRSRVSLAEPSLSSFSQRPLTGTLLPVSQGLSP